MDFARPYHRSCSWVHFPEIDSTHRHCDRELNVFPVDQLTVISADAQTAGVGQGNRAWVTGPGLDLMMNFAFFVPPEWQHFQPGQAHLVMAVSAVEALRSFTGLILGADAGLFRFELKWPNDVICNGRKIGGLLAQLQPATPQRPMGVYVGIGINVNSGRAALDQIDRPVWPATSLRAELEGMPEEPHFDVKVLRDLLAFTFFHNLRRLRSDQANFARLFQPLLRQMYVLLGQRIRFNTKARDEGPARAENILEGTFEGVNEENHLQLRLDNGAVATQLVGEIVL
jgi:BirA family transcriptional regulator, biotin operon repressor / biotin---[acetyl-CoA-carboxylase] ligase